MTYRHLREHVLDEVRGGLGHAPGGAGRAQAAALAGEGDLEVVATSVAVRAGEATGEDPALEVATQLALDVTGDRYTVGVGFAPRCQPGLEMLLHHSVEHCALGAATAVDERRAGAVRVTDWREAGRHPCLAMCSGSTGDSRRRARRGGANRARSRENGIGAEHHRPLETLVSRGTTNRQPGAVGRCHGT